MSIVRALWTRILDEPVLSLGVVEAVLALAVGFGLRLTGEQVALIMAAAAAVVSFIARQRVTPL